MFTTHGDCRRTLTISAILRRIRRIISQMDVTMGQVTGARLIQLLAVEIKRLAEKLNLGAKV